MLKKWPSADHVECTNNPNNPTIIFPRWGKVNLPNVRKLLSGQKKKFSIYPTLLIQAVSLSNLIKFFHLIYKNKMTELEHHHFDIPNKLIDLSFRQKWLLIYKKKNTRHHYNLINVVNKHTTTNSCQRTWTWIYKSLWIHSKFAGNIEDRGTCNNCTEYAISKFSLWETPQVKRPELFNRYSIRKRKKGKLQVFKIYQVLKSSRQSKLYCPGMHTWTIKPEYEWLL